MSNEQRVATCMYVSGRLEGIGQKDEIDNYDYDKQVANCEIIESTYVQSETREQVGLYMDEIIPSNSTLNVI